MRILAVLAGWFLLGVLVFVVRIHLPVFLAPSTYGELWDEVEAYHLKREGHLSEDQMTTKYGPEIVKMYILEPDFGICYVPSERAAFVNLIGYLRGDDFEENDKWIWPLAAASLLVLLYLPIVSGFRITIQSISGFVCRRIRHAELYEQYMSVWRTRKRRTAFLSLGAVTLAALANAFLRSSPELDRIEIGLVDLTVSFVVLAFFSGLWLKLLTFLIDGLFLCVGVNPNHTIWDEAMALVVMAPILYFLFQNTLLTVVSGAIAGLATGLLFKWQVKRTRGRTPPPVPQQAPI